MKTLPLAIALSATLLVGASTIAFAQVAEDPALVKIEAPKNARAVKIKNVPSALMAYWLDPKHNTQPTMLGAVELSKKIEKGAFTLPDGIEGISSIDEQNVLLITGSAEAIRQVEELIDVLDQPLRQVEIETQFVGISPEDLKTFGIDFSEIRDNAGKPQAIPGGFQIGYVRNNFTARLNALLAAGKAKIFSAPRVTAINNLSATIKAKSETKIVDGTPVTIERGYSITPTINGDETITVLFGDTKTPVKGKTGLLTVVNLRDGDTCALLSVMNGQRAAVIFLTARIIRRAGDNIEVPGT